MTIETQDELALLPCPFCGDDKPSFERKGTHRQSCIVICGNCGCRHESSDEGAHSGSSWNFRAEAGKAEPAAWIATHNSGRTVHFAKADGWNIHPVLHVRAPVIVAWLVEWTARGQVELNKLPRTLEFRKPSSFGLYGLAQKAYALCYATPGTAPAEPAAEQEGKQCPHSFDDIENAWADGLCAYCLRDELAALKGDAQDAKRYRKAKAMGWIDPVAGCRIHPNSPAANTIDRAADIAIAVAKEPNRE